MSIGNHSENPTTKIIQGRFFHIFSTSSNDSASLMKRQQFPHLVPRYRTDLVTSQVLVPNGHRLQVTSPVMRILSEEHPIPQKKGFFPSDFASFGISFERRWIVSEKTAEFGCNHSHPTGGDSLMATQGNVQLNCLVNPTSLSKIWEKYTHLGQIKNSLPNRTKGESIWEIHFPPNNFHINGFTNSNQLIQQLQPNQLIQSQNLPPRPVLTLKF